MGGSQVKETSNQSISRPVTLTVSDQLWEEAQEYAAESKVWIVQRRRTALWWQAYGKISADDVKALVTAFYVDAASDAGSVRARAVCVNDGAQISPHKEDETHF